MDKIIEQLCDRYIEKIKGKKFGEGEFSSDYIYNMTLELKRNAKNFPIDKSNRWLGYIQGILTINKIINVEEERDFTRPLFHEYYKKNNIKIPDSISIKN